MTMTIITTMTKMGRSPRLLLLLLLLLVTACVLYSNITMPMPNSSSDLYQYQSSLNNKLGVTLTQQVILNISLYFFSSVGISGLCHPSSHQFAPVFPQCDLQHESTASATSSARLFATERRKLEDEEYERYKQLRNYYAYEDDLVEEVVVYEEPPKSDWFYIYHALMTLLCVMVCALMSGLYIGLLSLDPLLLVIKMRAGETEQERKQAAKLLPIVKQRHRLIVTLLIMNSMATEALPVFLQVLVPDAVAVIVSVVLVLFFGEILPTAFFTGPDQIKIAGRWAPLVSFFLFVLGPVAIPISRMLERISAMNGSSDDASNSGGGGGDEHNFCGTVYNRSELAALIRVQYEERMALKQRRKEMRQASISSLQDLDTTDIAVSNDLRALKADIIRSPESLIRSTGSIDSHDVLMIEGALQMKTKTAMDVSMSFHKVFCIPNDMLLDDTNIFTIYASGFSRVPVYTNGDRRLVKGILMTRQLMVVRGTEMCPLVSSMKLHIPHCVSPETNLVDLVNLFQKGGSAVRVGHMALVCARPDIANDALDHGQAVPEEAGLMGIITLEDVLEALLQEQIYDEMDAAGRKSQHIYDEDNVLDKFPYQVYSINTIQEVDSHSSYHLQEDDTSHKGSSSGQIV